jgi:hypothetical protein
MIVLCSTTMSSLDLGAHIGASLQESNSEKQLEEKKAQNRQA